MEWEKVPGALRRSLSSRGCRGSDSSRSFIGVRMLKASSRKGISTIASISERRPFPSPRTPSQRASCGPPPPIKPTANVTTPMTAAMTSPAFSSRWREEVIAAKNPYVDAGDHHHQEHEPRSEEHGSDDGEPGERREIRIEIELDKEPGERGKKYRERGGENEPYRRVRLEYAFPEAFQEIPADPHLGSDDDADPDQSHPRVRRLEQVE